MFNFQNFNVPDLIALKRDGKVFTAELLNYAVRTICDGTMDDAQLGAFLMAVYLKGLNDEETTDLTVAMRDSGYKFQWPRLWKVVDKHSTGGVGDKISLVLAPVLASLGLKVPMISGRGLAHTGGTLDKLESIPGFRANLSEKEIQEALEKVGCCITGQTGVLVPADKRMYATRDVTGTVGSLPLIVSSILSKKSCESPHSLVLDVKFGSGGIFKDIRESRELARSLVRVGNMLGIKTSALVTSNETPIGRMIGNALEVAEAVQCLANVGPQDLQNLVIELGSELLVSCEHVADLSEGQKVIEKALMDGTALQVFKKMIEYQGVSTEISEKLCGKTPDFTVLPRTKFSTKMTSCASGTIQSINALKIADVCLWLKAGRFFKNDEIQYGAGVELLKIEGEKIEKDEPWAVLYHNAPLDQNILEKAKNCIEITASTDNLKARNKSLVFDRIRN